MKKDGSRKNSLKRKLKEEGTSPVDIKGVSETLDEAKDEEFHIVNLTPENFNKIALGESGGVDNDVLIFFHKENCVGCSNLAVYYKFVSSRFFEMNISSVVVARLDISSPAWSELGVSTLTNIFLPDVDVAKLPSILLLPSNRKTSPYMYFSGLGKTQPIMRWVEQNAGIKFDLGELPHLNDGDKILYKEQIEERSNARKARLMDVGKGEDKVEELVLDDEKVGPKKNKKKKKKKKGNKMKNGEF